MPGDDGYRGGQVIYTEPEVADLTKPSKVQSFWKVQSFLVTHSPRYTFTLEPYDDGTPDPTVVTKEVDMVVTAPFLLARADFSKTEVVKTCTYIIVAPDMDYWKQTIEVKKGAQLVRMKTVTVRIFNLFHVLGNKISVWESDELKIFKFYKHHEIRPQIHLMKIEVIKYQAPDGSIKSRVIRGKEG